ncbi:MAG: peptidoglycan-associated lipoprotein Pal [Woeseiaceae bacterium]|nr:peptidoglycan-associated lipoprotein Pal [Woeseiaceae bacterium]
MSYFKLFSILALSFLLAGCPGTPPMPDPEPTDTTYGGDAGASTSGTGSDPYGGGQMMDDPFAGNEVENVIYFEFDSSEVRAQDQDIVAGHAAMLNSNPNLRVRLEGHADERGSREYNIGLGERRSQAVRQMLMIQGVSASQIATVSFGEERPVAFGSSESDYSQNRRVEFVYPN